MRLLAFCPAALAALSLAGCLPDTGECEPIAATRIHYTEDAAGLPAYGGQALVQASCGGGSFCHSEGIDPAGRFGAPAGLDLDLGLGLAETPEQTERLRRHVERVREERRSVWQQVHEGWMPPGAVGAEVVALSARYGGLPSIDTAQGRETLRNWLACGAPVIERTTPRPTGIEPVGDVVPARACAGLSCGGACVDPAADPAHCGGCDRACPAGTVCGGGECLAGCAAGTIECAGGCVDPARDDRHCGTCGNACAAGEACVAGTCGASVCPSGLTECGGACVDTRGDAAHCGRCDGACAAGEVCSGGACRACDASVTLSGSVQPLFTATCTGSMCHSGTAPQAGLSLEPGQSHGDLVGVPASRCADGRLLVDPGRPDASYLIDKLTGTHLCNGMRMPLRADPLSASQIDGIRDWICRGAPND